MMDKAHLPAIAPADAAVLKNYKKHIDKATKFIPTWVKVAVAIALGLGTMIGWKRIVITVGEKIGKDHLTYAQGAAAELTAMATIGAADAFGLPVSTTHVLSSGVAGTMAANKTGLQWGTVRNLADGLGADAAGFDPPVGLALLGVHADERQLGALSPKSPLATHLANRRWTPGRGILGSPVAATAPERPAGVPEGGFWNPELGGWEVSRLSAQGVREGECLFYRRDGSLQSRCDSWRASGRGRSRCSIPTGACRARDLHRRTRGGDRLGISRRRARGRAAALLLRAAGRRPPRPSLREGRHRPGDLLRRRRSANPGGWPAVAPAPVRRPRRRRVRRGEHAVGAAAAGAAPLLDRRGRAHLGDRICEGGAARRPDVRRRRAARRGVRVFPRRGPSRRVRSVLSGRDRKPVRRPAHPRGARHLRPGTGGGDLVVSRRDGRGAENGGARSAVRRRRRGGLSGVRAGRRPGRRKGRRKTGGLVARAARGGARARGALRGGPGGGRAAEIAPRSSVRSPPTSWRSPRHSPRNEAKRSNSRSI